MKHTISVLTLVAFFTGGCTGLLTGGREKVPTLKSAEAKKLQKDNKYPASIAAFQKIIEEYPNSDWAANSIYSIATAYVSVENPRKDYVQGSYTSKSSCTSTRSTSVQRMPGTGARLSR